MTSSDTDAEKDARKSIRLALKIPMTILGRDRSGNDYAITVETIDVSAYGFSIQLPRECVSSGDDVFISVATKFNARAKVRWLDDGDKSSTTVRCGIELVEPYSNWVLTK